MTSYLDRNNIIELFSSDDEDVTVVGSSCRTQQAGTKGERSREHGHGMRRSLSVRFRGHHGPARRQHCHHHQQQASEVVDLTSDLPETETADDIVIVEENPAVKRRRRNGKAPAAASNTSPSAPAIIKCPVCLDPIQVMTSTICGHVFCDACIRAAIKVQKRCPTCRKPLTARSLHRIFLS
mmetsp:Transcript_11267/g.31955  ORF Transcript_11267/g.31955 Transcript_11267/m.31955 type:complete len:181 (+) Transcript_11267:684-1226(+)